MPARWLIGPGLLLVGIGLILMAGLSGDSTWTHLIPGFIVSGLGGGMVNPPLASTAIGVVPPHQAGMASGVNSTFRQVGIATGIAALGSIFAAALERNLAHALAVPSLAVSTASAPRVATMVRQGQVGQLLASLPAATRGQVAAALRSAFAAGLNDLLLVTGALAFAGALCALLLIRSKAPSGRQQSAQAGRTEPAGDLARGQGSRCGQHERGPFGMKRRSERCRAPGRVRGGALGLGAEGLHGARGVLGAVDGRAGHEHVGARLHATLDGLLADPAVDLEPHRGVPPADQRRGPGAASAAPCRGRAGRRNPAPPSSAAACRPRAADPGTVPRPCPG